MLLQSTDNRKGVNEHRASDSFILTRQSAAYIEVVMRVTIQLASLPQCDHEEFSADQEPMMSTAWGRATADKELVMLRKCRAYGLQYDSLGKDYPTVSDQAHKTPCLRKKFCVQVTA